MQLGEILDGSFNIYRRHFGLFMRLSLVLVWLPTALAVYLQVRFSGSPFEVLSLLEQHPVASILLGLLAVIIWTTAGLLLKAGTIRIISDSYLGQEPDLGASLRFGVAKIIPLLLVALSKGLLLILIYVFGAIGIGLAVVVGRLAGPGIAGLLGFAGFVGVAWFVIWVACGYGVTTPTVVLEELPSSFDAFGRSWELTRAARGKVFGTVSVAWLMSQFLPQMVVGGISGALGAAGNVSLQPVFVVLASLMGIVLAPILPCALTLLYYDLRVRREAFDLQVLSDQLGIR
ncbi:MAG TPA: hypothetical protein VGQ48_13285 [Gemmatimonadales bacterium]|jgi:hypothetical protein|nr:hypothetical protein [Gemmatimonadales bacterium]